MAALALTPHRTSAQSHDVHFPLPLGAGVNKGNVDNKTGPDYYYFYAGPGHVNLKFGFKPSGALGQRQTLSFDLYTESGRLISHNTVTSPDKLEYQSNSGDFDSYHKVTLRVMAPQPVSGYYEIEITGAVGFGGLEPAGADAQPIHTMLYKPRGKVFLVQETPDELRITLAADILFDSNKASIRPSAAAALHQAAKLIRSKDHGAVRIDAYTDAKGEATDNLRLSEERAAAVKAWLVANEQFADAQLAARGLGAANPIEPNAKADGSDNPEGRRRNRRVDLIVTK